MGTIIVQIVFVDDCGENVTVTFDLFADALDRMDELMRNCNDFNVTYFNR